MYDFSSDTNPPREENKVFKLTILNTNIRPICPKINSVVEAFEELEAGFGVFTETWLSDGSDLEKKLDDLREGSALVPSP